MSISRWGSAESCLDRRTCETCPRVSVLPVLITGPRPSQALEADLKRQQEIEAERRAGEEKAERDKREAVS